MKKLISNTSFGFYLRGLDLNDHKYTELRDNFDMFLSQKLEIWMFVPCKSVDGIWVILEEINEEYPNNIEYFEEIKEYQEAKERCLFEGFEVVSNTNFVTIWQLNGKYLNWDKKDNHFTFFSGFNIEKLMQDFDLKLTATAQKQIGL